jgi:hypothetical protein
MWVEFVLARDDLEKVVNDFCPLRLKLGDNGNILLADPHDLILVPEVGLRVSISAEVHWPVLGIQIPVSVRSTTLQVTVRIVKEEGGSRLRFGFQLSNADLSMVPAMVTRGVVDRVNKELASADLSWMFTKTLSHDFGLPESLLSARALDLSAVSGHLKVTAEALVLAVKLHGTVEPRLLPAPQP